MNYRQPFEGDYAISQKFGETYTNKTGHTGIDYLCPVSTPILASETGKVFYAGWKNGGYGYCVFLTHSDGNVTIYEHLLSDIPVTVGQVVPRGQVIGYSGSTGNSTGPHLHFEICDKNGKAFDPMTVLHSVDDSIVVQKPTIPVHPKLKGSESLSEDVQVVAPLGAWGWSSDFSRRATVFQQGTRLHYTGRTRERNGYTYCEVYPEPIKYWVAVHDGDCQILDNE